MNPAYIKVLIAAIALAAAAAGGWWINGWKLGEELARRQGVIDTQKQSLATLAGANERCTAGVQDVKTAVQGYIAEGARRSEAAAAAMEHAAAAAQGHQDAAKAALNRLQAPKGKECDTAAAEASAYARKRKGAP